MELFPAKMNFKIKIIGKIDVYLVISKICS